MQLIAASGIPAGFEERGLLILSGFPGLALPRLRETPAGFEERDLLILSGSPGLALPRLRETPIVHQNELHVNC